jgi:Asp-tRNA(Asn)/Glu-tRNA(Gln) amidotransferase A subunit family amidase
LAGLGHEVIEIRPSFLERYGQVLGAEVQTVVDANRAGVEAPATMLAGLICSLANFAGQPAVTIPTVQGAVPVGVQLQGPAWSDEALLDVVASGWPVAPSSPAMAAM